ncbi:MAG: PaaI family thioesterase [Prevotella sp.]|nr:PaaI family thioesterase [Staphylococcus sp.]MCM1350068.1 PaaI family thioesterase [Prevotella sp.]
MKVIRKQSNSKMCYICGMDNPFGLKAPFYEMENQTVVSLFRYQDIHQSYPERVHGGLITALLDEIAGRAIWIVEPNTWAVTGDIRVKFRKVVPYDTDLKAIGKVTRNTRRIFFAVAKLYDMNNELLAEAEVTYFKLPLDKIATANTHEDVNVIVLDDVKEIDNLPEVE